MPTPRHDRALAVGIAGPSASGKSTFARDLRSALAPLRAVLLAQDNYYRGLPAHIDAAQFNFDEPAAVDLDRMASDLRSLKRAEAARIPVYDFVRHRREPRPRRVAPAPVVIAEGLHLFMHDALRALLDIKIYIECPLAECLRRRLARDSRERGRSAADITRQFHRQVEPMHRLHVAPTARFADHILALPDPESPEYAAAVAQLARAVEARVAAAAGENTP